MDVLRNKTLRSRPFYCFIFKGLVHTNHRETFKSLSYTCMVRFCTSWGQGQHNFYCFNLFGGEEDFISSGGGDDNWIFTFWWTVPLSLTFNIPLRLAVKCIVTELKTTKLLMVLSIVIYPAVRMSSSCSSNINPKLSLLLLALITSCFLHNVHLHVGSVYKTAADAQKDRHIFEALASTVLSSLC